MVTMARSAANWRNTHTHVNRTHSLTLLHQHSCNNRCAKRQLNYYSIWNRFVILKLPYLFAWFSQCKDYYALSSSFDVASVAYVTCLQQW